MKNYDKLQDYFVKADKKASKDAEGGHSVSNIANRRKYLTASHLLATSMRPTTEMVASACETLSAVLADLEGDEVFIIPLSREEARALLDQHAATQPKE